MNMVLRCLWCYDVYGNRLSVLLQCLVNCTKMSMVLRCFGVKMSMVLRCLGVKMSMVQYVCATKILKPHRTERSLSILENFFLQPCFFVFL